MKEMFRGQIYYVDFGKGLGSEQAGIRPAVIVQNDIGNKHSTTFIVVPLTSEIKRLDMPTHVLVGTYCGLSEKSIAVCEQVTTRSEMRFMQFVGEVSPEDMKKITDGVWISTGGDPRYNKPYIDLLPEYGGGEDRPEELLLCLCSVCLSQFLNSNEHIVRRVDPFQKRDADCTYCNVRKGVDYRIIARKKRLGDDRV